MLRQRIYVESFIHAPLEEVWDKTQTPAAHRRWDLRFTDIDYLPRSDASQPQRFRYATRIGFGVEIEGAGESVSNHESPNDTHTSVLKFWSDDAKSLISKGAGFWKYIPANGGTRFLTLYDYETRFGLPGRTFDRFIFRPLMRWATAWSFDRLRLWLEESVEPHISLERSIIHALARCTIAFVWLYHGIIPKLIIQDGDELIMLHDAGVPLAQASFVLQTVGVCEVLFGLLFLVTWRWRTLFLVNIAMMLVALLGIAVNSPRYLLAAFNPATLNMLMIALSITGFLASRHLPSARHCVRRQSQTSLAKESQV